MQQLPIDCELAHAPLHGVGYRIVASDHTALRIGVWTDETTQKGTIFLLPGRADYIEKQGHAISEMHAKGFSVCVLEFRGLGLSDRIATDRRAGHVDQFSDYQLDVQAAISAASELELPQPFYVHGNSMGGCIALRNLMGEHRFKACAFTSPMWGIKLPKILLMIAPVVTGTARALGFGQRYAPGKNGENETLAWTFEENEITADADMFAHLQHVNRLTHEHWIGGPTIGWLQQALHETKSLASLPAPDIPCIAFSAELDQLVSRDAIENRMANWNDGRYEMIPAVKHDLLRADLVTRSSVIGKICDFFEDAG
ncbi:hydrolase [Tateyamaria omphalii]|uniref:alpha/beta hydrolase n=1 Tax=Tateyamaria omphalii TaxID=299262 RepID=UPI001678961E|nr:alpha/beta hydrolase [Tateyamaria omphalii]GGX72497.1 hydrolase [Tateyamaria omphalii]